MVENSKIEWTHHTANLWWGCTKVHTGCKHCYAETLAHRYNNKIWGDENPRKLIKSVWGDLDKFQIAAKKAGEIHRVFVGSMMDIFEKPMSLINNVAAPANGDTGNIRSVLFSRIDSGHYPNLLFLLLTKRPHNINFFIPSHWKETPPSNVMFGCSVSDQDTADKYIPILLKVKGKHFISLEPQVGPVNLRNWLMISHDKDGLSRSFGDIHWVIQGGESGNIKREFKLEWAYLMKKQCEEANVPYFFKQIDKVQPIPEELLIRQFPTI